MQNDLIGLAAEQSTKLFGDKNDGLFSAACFAQVIARLSNTSHLMDGRVVRTILTGRNDIYVMPGCSHYKLAFYE